jgi:hypothetical protein
MLILEIFLKFPCSFLQNIVYTGLSNSMQQSPSLKADSHSAGQGVPRLLWNLKVHYHICDCHHWPLFWARLIWSTPCFNWAPHHEAYWGMGVYHHAFLTSALDEGEWSASHPSCFTSRERDPGTHWIGGWVGPRPYPPYFSETCSSSLLVYA